jgi:transposase
VTKEYYPEIMKRLCEAIRKKKARCLEVRPMDNAPAHTALLIRQFLAKHETTVTPQPLYSPDLAPADFFIFPKLKMSLRGLRFESIDSIKENLLADLRSIPNEAFQKCFEGWRKCWERCIQSGGDYFEGDNAE